MNLSPQEYKFTDDDAQRIVSLGYTLIKQGTLSFTYFMVQEFPDFDLLALLEELERSFTPATHLVIHREISFQETVPYLRINYRNNFVAINDALIFDREFFKVGLQIRVNHNYCVLPISERGKGLVKNVFQTSLQQYINMGLGMILVHAGLEQGGYVWAKHGFVAIERHEVEYILDDARMKLSASEFIPVKHIFDKYYADFPQGKEFPMILWALYAPMKVILSGSDWHGALDLQNPKQFRNFISYVFRQ